MLQGMDVMRPGDVYEGEVGGGGGPVAVRDGAAANSRSFLKVMLSGADCQALQSNDDKWCGRGTDRSVTRGIG